MLLGLVSCQDTNLNLNEKIFESEFHKLYPSGKDEAKASAALAAAEQQVPWDPFAGKLLDW